MDCHAFSYGSGAAGRHNFPYRIMEGGAALVRDCIPLRLGAMCGEPIKSSLHGSQLLANKPLTTKLPFARSDSGRTPVSALGLIVGSVMGPITPVSLSVGAT